MSEILQTLFSGHGVHCLLYDNVTYTVCCPGISLVWNFPPLYTSICLSFDDGLYTTTYNIIIDFTSVVEHSSGCTKIYLYSTLSHTL